jgi:hypothetical protein
MKMWLLVGLNPIAITTDTEVRASVARFRK